MSIVNISSENKIHPDDTDTDFWIQLKRPLQKIIGMQVLNVSIPLTYDVVSDATDKKKHPHNVLHFSEDFWHNDGGAQLPILIPNGTHNIDQLCLSLEEGMNLIADHGRINGFLKDQSIFTHLATHRNGNQRQLHINNRNHDIKLGETNIKNPYNLDLYTQVDITALEAGYIVADDTDAKRTLYVITHVSKNGKTFTAIKIMSPLDTNDGILDPHQDNVASVGLVTEEITSGGVNGNIANWSIVWPGYLVFMDPIYNRVVIANGNVGKYWHDYTAGPTIQAPPLSSSNETYDHDTLGIVHGFSFGGLLTNSLRILKTYGFVSSPNVGERVGDPIYGSGEENNGDWYHGHGGVTAPIINKQIFDEDTLEPVTGLPARLLLRKDRDFNLGWVMILTNIPETQGPGLLYLRVMGDVILDQQNSETNMNDRIPIPLDRNYGEVVHYEHDAEADVIPFAVPCDVTRLHIKLEYGDDNIPVGGSKSLNGQFMHLRLKFFKMHQKKGGKM